MLSWLPESDVLQNALDSMVKNAYIYGRESIGRQVIEIQLILEILVGFFYLHLANKAQCIPAWR